MTRLLLSFFLLTNLVFAEASGDKKILEFKAKGSGGKAKQILLIAGDEEYRSEESMPMLAKILSERHGFNTQVIFSWDSKENIINPNDQRGMLHFNLLDKADLVIIGTRFRTPSQEQAMYMTKYLEQGKPLVGIRTATHAFRGHGQFDKDIPYKKFGLKILGEEWVAHHGRHKRQGTRAVIEEEQQEHPILNSVKDIFGPTDVYSVKNLSKQDTILLRGAVTKSLEPDSEILKSKKNEPMMPIAWLHPYKTSQGQPGVSFCTTMGASVDFVSQDLRRLIINACYHLLELKVPQKANVDFVDPFIPSFYGFIKNKKHWSKRALTCADFELGQKTEAHDPPGSPEWPHRQENKKSVSVK